VRALLFALVIALAAPSSIALANCCKCGDGACQNTDNILTCDACDSVCKDNGGAAQVGASLCQTDGCTTTITPCMGGASTPTSTPAATQTATASHTRTATPSPQPTGAFCTEPGQCQSEFCVDDVCCDTACDAPGEACDVLGHVGACTAVSNTEPAPAMSNSGLLIAAALLAVAGTVLVRRRKHGS
jgi:hypothetical protein